MEPNYITIRPVKHLITLSSGTTYTYGSTQTSLNRHAVRRALVLRASSTTTTIWPGEFVEVTLPKDICCSDATFALKPRTDAPVSKYAKKLMHGHNQHSSPASRARSASPTSQILYANLTEYMPVVQWVCRVPRPH